MQKIAFVEEARFTRANVPAAPVKLQKKVAEGRKGGNFGGGGGGGGSSGKFSATAQVGGAARDLKGKGGMRNDNNFSARRTI